MTSDAGFERDVRALVALACDDLDIESPDVRFRADAFSIRVDPSGVLHVPTAGRAHHERFGNVPTDTARGLADALKRHEMRTHAKGDDPELVEIEAMLFAEVFVRDRVLGEHER